MRTNVTVRSDSPEAIPRPKLLHSPSLPFIRSIPSYHLLFSLFLFFFCFSIFLGVYEWFTLNSKQRRRRHLGLGWETQRKESSTQLQRVHPSHLSLSPLSIVFIVLLSFIDFNTEQLSQLILPRNEPDSQAQLAPNPLNVNCSITSFGGNFLSASILSPSSRYLSLYIFNFSLS